MSPELAKAIDAATDLAWFTHANLGSALIYAERLEAHDRLVEAVKDIGYVSPATRTELLLLIEAMKRVAAASFCNRRGLPYHERKQAVFELRGCLDVYRRSTA